MGGARQSVEAGRSTVAVTVDGTDVTFSSTELTLSARPEAFGSAWLIPGLALVRRLHVTEPVDRRWAAGVARIPPLVGPWWDHPPLMPRLRVGPSRPRFLRSGRGRALCFTGGVDSLHALLCRRSAPPDVLVFAAGFDARPADNIRLADLAGTVRAVAERRGRRSAVILSDLRAHPTFNRISWEQSHGGALAALGHVLSAEVGTLEIASSFVPAQAKPWGSRWDLDHLWSSSACEVVHVGHHRTREQKLADLAAHPWVWPLLRVCWESDGSAGNCGRCDKCVVTAVGAGLAGVDIPGLPDRAGQASAIDELKATAYLRSYGRFLAAGAMDAETARSAGRLLERTAAPGRSHPQDERAAPP